MPTLHPHAHSHGTTAAPATEGIVIHKASIYDRFATPLVVRSNAKIAQLSGVKVGDKVLDFGCGPGSLTLAMKEAAGSGGEVYGIDASPEMIKVAQDNATRKGLAVNFQLGLAEALPFEDNTFDLIVSRLVIHHLPGDLKRRGFAEMYRVLKPGGRAFIVDFEIRGNNHLVHFVVAKLMSERMAEIKVKNYLPLLEEAGFSEIKMGSLGGRFLSYVTGTAKNK